MSIRLGTVPAILEVDEDDFAIFVEEVFNILGSDVRREVTNVNPRLVLSNLSHDEFLELVFT